MCSTEFTSYSQTCVSRKVTWNSIYPHKFERKNPPLLCPPSPPPPKQKEAWKAVVNSFQKLQVTDSLICLKLGVPDSSGLSQTKLSPQRLHSETDCSPAQKKHTGNKHEDIYICASQSVPQKRGLGKTSCWQGITQSRLSPSKSTHRTEKPVLKSFSQPLSLRCLWVRVNCQEHSILARPNNTTAPPPQLYMPPTSNVRLVAPGSLWSQPQWNPMSPPFPTLPSPFIIFLTSQSKTFFWFLIITNPGHCYSPADVQGLCRVQSGANSTPIEWSRGTDSKRTPTSL